MRIFSVLVLVLGVAASLGVAGDMSLKDSSLIDQMAEILQAEPAVRKVEVWSNEYAQGLKITTIHYEIKTTLLEPLMLRQVPAFLESSYRAYQQVLPGKLSTANLMSVYLFADRQQWESFTKSFTGNLWPAYHKIKRGAYYYNGSCVAYNIGRTRTFSVLAHEGWHQFSSRYFAFRLPSWMDEGLAMQFESYHKSNGMFDFDTSQNLARLGGLHVAIRNKKMLSLKELLSLNPGQVVGSEEGQVSGYYSQVYALVRFLREYDYGIYRQSFETLLWGGLQGDWPLTENASQLLRDRNVPFSSFWNSQLGTGLFAHYVSKDIDLLEKQYLSYCIKLARRVKVSSSH